MRPHALEEGPSGRCAGDGAGRGGRRRTVYSENDIGGTSLAAPLPAGMVTAAQQGQPVPFGFLNPVLYQLYGTDAYHPTLPLTSHSPALYRAVYCPAAVCSPGEGRCVQRAAGCFPDQCVAK